MSDYFSDLLTLNDCSHTSPLLVVICSVGVCRDIIW